MRCCTFIVFALFLAVGVFGQRTIPTTAPLKDKLVEKFESHDEIALHTFLRFGAETRMPLGLIQNGGQLCMSRTNVVAESESVGSIADKLTAPVGYTWAVEDGVLIIQPQHTSVGALQLLSTVIPRFAAPRTTLEGLGVFLAVDVRAVFRPDLGSAGSLFQSPNATLVGPIEMHNITVKQALNQIVKSGESGQWILHSIRDDYRAAAETKFVDIIDYGSNPIQTIQRLSCEP